MEEKKPDDTNVTSMQEITGNLKKLRIEFQLINEGRIKERNDFLNVLQHQFNSASAEIELLKKKYSELDDTNISTMEEAVEDLQALVIELDLIKIEFAKLCARELSGYIIVNKFKVNIRDFFSF